MKHCIKGSNKAQKADAIKLSHLKTFTADPLLIPFYVEVEKCFKEKFELAVQEHMPFDEPNVKKLKEEIGRMNIAVQNLNSDYAQKLRKSFEKYERFAGSRTESHCPSRVVTVIPLINF